MSEGLIIPIDLRDAIPRPREEHIARHGPRRLVKLAPVMGGVPVIWTSPYTVEDVGEDGSKVLCRICIVLVQKNPPETMRLRLPTDLIDKLHDVPVEW